MRTTNHLTACFVACAAWPTLAAASAGLPVTNPGDGDDPPEMDPRATYELPSATPEELEALKARFFRAPKETAEATSDSEWQSLRIGTYGSKSKINTPRPLLEWGRALYNNQVPTKEGTNLLGESNLLFPHFYVYGDWRTAVGYSDLGNDHTSRLATRLNLDLDLGITATERIHALIRPLDRGNRFTQLGFSGLDEEEDEILLDGNLETLFFEGDLGAMFGGPSSDSIPIAAGLVPLLFQNGVWVEDAFNGVAVSLPAKNSPKFDIANYDWTFFAGFDDVTTGADNFAEDTSIFGVTGFLEATGGYWEIGYAYADVDSQIDGLSYHNVTAAYSRRFGTLMSSSVRVIGNLGQDPDVGGIPVDKTADGVLLLLENSLITKNPYTVLPYFNVFAGFGTPQSLARAAGAGGVLKNTGLNFEADALSAFPALDATGHDAVGAAIGIQYLFGLIESQLVLELAGQHAHGDDAKAAGDEFALGLRYQKPMNIFGRRTALMRFDAMYGTRDEAEDISGARVEFRWKF